MKTRGILNSSGTMSRQAILLLIFLLLLQVGCELEDGEQPTTIPSVAEMEAVLAVQWETFSEAAKAKDIAGVLSVFTPDMRLLSDPGGLEDIRGRDAYGSIMEAAFPTVTVVDVSTAWDEILILDSESFMELGKWSEVYAFEESPDTLRAFGAYVSLWNKQPDGQWRIHRFIRNRHDFANPNIEVAVEGS